jgi:hypothetical protein
MSANGSTDVLPASSLSDSGINDCSNRSFPAMLTSQSTVSTLSNVSNDVGFVVPVSLCSTERSQADLAPTSVSFKIRPDLPSMKSSKRSLLWKYFAHFDSLFHPTMRNHRICLVCREVGVDKSNSVGRSASTGPLLGHLRTHNLEYLEYIEAKDAALMEASKVAAAEDVDQTSIVSYFPTVANTKMLFKRKFAT